MAAAKAQVKVSSKERNRKNDELDAHYTDHDHDQSYAASFIMEVSGTARTSRLATQQSDDQSFDSLVGPDHDTTAAKNNIVLSGRANSVHLSLRVVFSCIMSQLNFNTEGFIMAIKERPSLWDLSSEDYSNRDIKKAGSLGRNYIDVWRK
ncbi:hypothetical protein J6590_101720 [Homalodisca vitripennis]|nr:hypothetical protein J6590_101720 [Homalodisca vitripennis]